MARWTQQGFHLGKRWLMGELVAESCTSLVPSFVGLLLTENESPILVHRRSYLSAQDRMD
jgi:hypothetical protein